LADHKSSDDEISLVKERILLFENYIIWKERKFQPFTCQRFIPFYRFRKRLSFG